MSATPTVRVRFFERFRDRATTWDWGVDKLDGIVALLANRHALGELVWTVQLADEVFSTAWQGNPPAERRFYRLSASCPKRGTVTLEIFPEDQSYGFQSEDIRHGIPYELAGGAP